LIKNKKFLIGFGAGLIISAILMSFMPGRKMNISDIENRARSLGMKYPTEMKAIEGGK